MKPTASLCNCTAWFVSDLVGNNADRFSRGKTHYISLYLKDFSVDSVSYFPVM